MTWYLDLDGLTKEDWDLFVQRGKRAQDAVNEIMVRVRSCMRCGHDSLAQERWEKATPDGPYIGVVTCGECGWVLEELGTRDSPPCKIVTEAPSRPQEPDEE